MAQHDYSIANQSGSAFRSDLNNALAAIVSNNSGTTQPTTTYAFQWWADTTTGQLKLRNAANSAWITITELDGTLLMENGSAASPGLAFASDLDTGLFRAGVNQLGIATNGVERVEFGTTEVVFNDGGNDIDFRIEGDTNSALFFVDAGNDRVGIGTTSPNEKLDVRGKLYLNNGSASYFDAASSNGLVITNPTAVRWEVNSSERARIDSSGRLLVGTSSTSSTGSLVQVNGRVEQVDGVFTKRAISTYTTGQTISVTVANAPAVIGNSESSIYKVFATRAVNASTVTFEHGFVYYSSNGTGTYVSVVDDANTTVSVSGTTISAQNTGGAATLRLVVTCETTAFNTGS